MNEPLETARNCLREALGALMEVSDARSSAIDEAIKIVDGKLREINARGTWDDKDRHTNDGAAQAAQEIGNALRVLKAI